MIKPLRSLFVIDKIEPFDEDLITPLRNHHHQIRHHEHVNQSENQDDHLFRFHPKACVDQQIAFSDELE